MSANRIRDPAGTAQAPVLPILDEKANPFWQPTPSQTDRKTSKLTKGAVLRWARRLDENGSWPPGKSLKGFEKWMNQSYTEAVRLATIVTKQTGIQHDAGHFFGIMMRGGMDAPDALGSQPAHMRSIPGPVKEYLLDKNRTRRFFGRPIQELLDADISVNQLYGFKNYLLHDVDWKGLPPDLKQRLAYTNEPFERVLGAAEGSVVDEVNSKALLTQLENEIKASDAKAIGVATGEQPGKVTTTQMDPKDMAGFNKLSQQPLTGNTLQAFQNVGKRIAKLAAPSVGGFSAGLSVAEAAERNRIANQTGNTWDRIQANISNVEAAADTAGIVPSWISPITEPTALIAGLSNTGIDIGRTLLAEPTAEQEAIRASIHKNFEKPMTAEGQKAYYEKVSRLRAEEEKAKREEQKAIEAEIKEEAIRRRIFESGGGNAAMTKYGWSIEETMNMGRKNELVQAYIYMPDKQ